MNKNEASTILIVDDNPTNLRVLVDYLSEVGYKTLVATSGEQTMRQLDHHTPDLILLDVMMPGIDGFETCRLIRDRANTSDTAVIFMTALSDTKSKISGFQAGGVDYVTKPFQLEEVSVRIHTHLTIQRQRQELQELNATKDKFFSIIAHDLRGPFSGLLGFSEILADPNRELTQAQRQRFSALLHDSASSVYELLDNLLIWATLERNVLDISAQKISLHDVAEKAFAVLDHVANEKKIDLVQAVPQNIVVYADPNAVSTILRNLISNAIKFTGVGGRIEVTATSSDDVVEVAVSDDGVGMTVETSQHIFEPQHLLSTVGTSGEKGTGLGLLICQELSARSKGEIWVKSELGKGSTFYFTLPIEDCPTPILADEMAAT